VDVGVEVGVLVGVEVGVAVPAGVDEIRQPVMWAKVPTAALTYSVV